MLCAEGFRDRSEKGRLKREDREAFGVFLPASASCAALLMATSTKKLWK